MISSRRRLERFGAARVVEHGASYSEDMTERHSGNSIKYALMNASISPSMTALTFDVW